MKDKLQQQALRLGKLLYSQRVLVVIVTSAVCIAYVIITTGAHTATTGRDEIRYQEGLNNFKRFKFDETAITKLRELKGEDVIIEPSLTDDRTNPFIQ
jgi:hypothetical protein